MARVRSLLAELKERIRTARLKAAVAVNRKSSSSSIGVSVAIFWTGKQPPVGECASSIVLLPIYAATLPEMTGLSPLKSKIL